MIAVIIFALVGLTLLVNNEEIIWMLVTVYDSIKEWAQSCY